MIVLPKVNSSINKLPIYDEAMKLEEFQDFGLTEELNSFLDEEGEMSQEFLDKEQTQELKLIKHTPLRQKEKRISE